MANEELKRCIEIIGGLSATARAVGVKDRRNVHYWTIAGLPAKWALPLREATVLAAIKKGVSLSEVPSLESLLIIQDARISA